MKTPSLLTLCLGSLALPIPAAEIHQATGVKVGEVTPDSAIIWTRLTRKSERNATGPRFEGTVREQKEAVESEAAPTFHGACPGLAGEIRLRYGARSDLSDARVADWSRVGADTDFSRAFRLSDLAPDTLYHYAVETRAGGAPHAPLHGRFRTAPRPDADTAIDFCVLTCQGYSDLDHPDGFRIYPAMLALQPRFVVWTGDNVYYDNDAPKAVTAGLARYHWERMYSLPRHVELLRGIASYWEKDDHDTLRNDSWPGTRMGSLTYAEGQAIFRQQVPVGESIYRSFRWGRHLQIWLTDGRDFRSPNTLPDGPEKTIWGREQKEWLKRTLKESDATWKIILSPTPIVGPDRGNKSDNHANANFRHEGDEIRAWLRANTPDNCVIICGDRHWQYHSVHPETGLHEFSVGAASDRHAGGSPGPDPAYHRFHRVKGGFLSGTASASRLVLRHRDVTGQVVHEHHMTR